jgi:hypothetical protein
MTEKHNGFTIVTDTSISGSHLAVARIPGIVALTTEHHDTEQDALDTIITETTPEPSISQLDKWMNEGVCSAIDGCPNIEIDGFCEHNYPSWFIYLGLV